MAMIVCMFIKDLDYNLILENSDITTCVLDNA